MKAYRIFATLVLCLPLRAQFVQQSSKLVGSNPQQGAFGVSQGSSVALSKDGNTALVGGPNDNDQGAVWVFVRSNGAWSQQGGKLTGSGGNFSGQGNGVALSDDGNTAIIGGPLDGSQGYGAAWVFTRANGAWTQQGGKLMPNDEAPSDLTFQTNGVRFCVSVAISADGNTFACGAIADNGNVGAAWVFTRTNGAWTQQGGKLVGSGVAGPFTADGHKFSSQQGHAVALSSDGNTLLVGVRETTTTSARCGYSRAPTGRGRNRAPSWWETAPWALPNRGIPWHSRRTATRRSSADPVTVP